MNVYNGDDQKAREALARIFNSGKAPAGAVDPRMVRVFNMLRPNYQFSFVAFGNKCLEILDEEKPKLQSYLWRLEGDISLSIDILDSEEGSEYLCLSAHFIDDNWKLRRLVLNFSQLGLMSAPPQEIILKSLHDWNIQSKISTITIVNDSRCNEIVEIVKDRIHKYNEFHLDGVLFRVYCCADFAKNLVVQYAYGSVSDIVYRIGEIYPLEKAVPTWKKRSDELKKAIWKYDEECFSSRNSTYGKMKRSKWDEVSDICDFVNNIYGLLSEVLESGFPTANKFLYNVAELHFYLIQQLTDYPTSSIKDVAEKMLPSSLRYMKDMYLLLAITSAMDPRLKMKYIEFFSSKFRSTSTDESFQVGPVLETLQNLYREHVTRVVTFEEETRVYTKKELLAREDPPALLKEYKDFIQLSTHRTSFELDRYLKEPVVPWSKNFDVLNWWKDASSRFPTLSRMARDVLAIPLCVAVGDEGLLMQQREIDPCLASCHPAFTNAFMCLRSWFLPN